MATNLVLQHRGNSRFPDDDRNSPEAAGRVSETVTDRYAG